MLGRPRAAFAGEHAIGADRIGRLVGDVEPGDAIGDRGERCRRLVPEVVRVGHQPDVGEVGLVEERERVRDRVHERDGLVLRRVRRLEAEADAGVAPRPRRSREAPP